MSGTLTLDQFLGRAPASPSAVPSAPTTGGGSVASPAPIAAPPPSASAGSAPSSGDGTLSLAQFLGQGSGSSVATGGTASSPSTSSPPPRSGLLANLGASTNEGIAATVSAPFGLLSGATNLLDRGVNAASRGIKGATGYDLGQLPMTKPLVTPGDVDSALGSATGGAADPRNVVAGSELEQLIRSGGRTATEAALGGMGAGILPEATGALGAAQDALSTGVTRQAVQAGVGGAVGQYAANRVPAPFASMADFAGNLVGGIGAAAAEGGARAAVGSVSNAVRSVTGGTLGRSQAITDASGAPIVGSDGSSVTATPSQMLMAGNRIANSTTDLPAVRAALANPPAPLVSGSDPTTFQLTGDPGLGNAERAASVRDPAAFNQRRFDQNAARIGAIQNMAPAAADPAAVGQAFRTQLDGMTSSANTDAETHGAAVRSAFDAAGTPITAEQAGATIKGDVASAYAPRIAAADQAVQGAQQSAQEATAGLGGGTGGGPGETALQAYGQQLRGGLATLNAAAKSNEGQLWDAIDPGGKLTVDLSPVRSAANTIQSVTSKFAEPMEGKPLATFQTAQMLPETAPFSDLAALRQRITGNMRDELSTNGRTPTYRNLTDLLSSVHDAMQGSVTDQAAREQGAVAFGALAPEDSIVGRLQSTARQDAQGYGSAGLSQQRAVGGFDTGGSVAPARSRSTGLGGLSRAEGQEQSRLGYGPSNPGLPSGGSPDESLIPFLTRMGGVRDPGGDLAAMDAGKARVAFLRRNGGMDLDTARGHAEEAGYLPEGSSTNDLLDAVDGELRGSKRYATAEATAGAYRRLQDGSDVARDVAARTQAHDALSDFAEEAGHTFTPDEREHAVGLIMQGHHPEDAARQAASASAAGALDHNARMNGVGRPGVDPLAMQADNGIAGGARGPVNFDQAAAGRYSAARAATADRHARFTNSPGVGNVLRPGATSDSFKLEDSRVPAALFSKGPGAAERVQAFLKAGASKPELVRTLTDYAAHDLRRTAERDDGSLDPAKFSRWMQQHDEALSALPDVRDRFRSAAAASDTLRAAQQARQDVADAYPLRQTVTDAETAQRAFVAGPRGAETVRSTLAAAGGASSTRQAIEDHAAAQLRSAASNPDGTLNAMKLASWKSGHESALSELPGLSGRLGSIESAQRALDDSAARHVEARNALTKSAASRFLDGRDPVKGVARILGSDRAVPQMEELARLTANSPEAREGLQRAVVEHLLRDHVSNVAAGNTGTHLLKSDAFQTFARRSPPALRAIFSNNQIKSMQDIAADLQRSNRSITDTKLPGGSNTPQDLHGAAKHSAGHGGHGNSFLQAMLVDRGGEILGSLFEHHLGGGMFAELGGEAAAIGLALGNARRAAGLRTVDDLVKEAMLHPRLADALLQRITSPANAKMLLPKVLSSIRGLAIRTPAIAGSPMAPLPPDTTRPEAEMLRNAPPVVGR